MNLDDVLSRSSGKENVCILNSHTKSGWGKVAAWDPAELLKGDVSSSELESFFARQRAKQRLVIGYLSYDYGAKLHGIKPTARHDLKTPDVWLAGFDNWLEFTTGPMKPRSIDLSLKPVMSRQAYAKAYKKVKDYILAGDVYQVNLTHRMEGSTDLSGPELFARLANGSRADFQAYLNLGDYEVISQSPERFISVKDREITTMPIKGTRPRGQTAAEDKAQRGDLVISSKDQAELNMITDLMRNDLGKICQPGSVSVVEQRKITAYPTLWHAHSTITGELRPNISPIGALASVLPGGSITGCPKKRAMEIIDELEPARRGVYTGSIFTVRPDGSLDSSIAIRTLIKQAENIYLSVGGGIVYDSDEADEYQESLDKARSFSDM